MTSHNINEFPKSFCLSAKPTNPPDSLKLQYIARQVKMSLLFILLSSCLSILVSSNKCHNLRSAMQEKPAFNDLKVA